MSTYGKSSFAPSAFTSRAATAAASGKPLFAHAAAVASGAASGIHPSVDVSQPNKAGQKIRESRDSDLQPTSLGIIIDFDGTGSMRDTPEVFVHKLPSIMTMLIKKNYVEYPHIMVGCINDAQSDRFPIQLGQFEVDNKIDVSITDLIAEGGGGGQSPPTESYDLTMYYIARHTSMDCYEKRGKKGYLFFIGDEMIRPMISPHEVKQHIGDTIEAPIPIQTIIDELNEKFDIHWIMPGGTSHWSDKQVENQLRGYFGEKYHRLEDASAIGEMITGLIGLGEGFDLDGVKRDMIDVGLDPMSVTSATTALATFAKTGAGLSKTGVASETLVGAGTGGNERL